MLNERATGVSFQKTLIDSVPEKVRVYFANSAGRIVGLDVSNIATGEAEIVLDFWTYGCINCIHIIPDLQALEEEFDEELVVIGVHSAKFLNEGDTENIRQVVMRYGVEHPVVNDRDFEVWHSWGAQAWPTVALIDPAGNVELIPLGEDYGKLDLFVDERVDAAFVVEPQLSRGEHEGLLRIIDRVADYFPHYQWGIILASEVWLQHQGDLLGRLIHTFRQACRSIKDRPGQTTDLGSRVFGVTPEVFECALRRDLPRWETNARLDMDGLQSALKVQETMGMPAADLSLGEMVSQL